MKLQVGVQLFSLMGELMEDYLKTLENVAAAGYKYVEYVDPPAGKYTPEEIGDKLQSLGLTAIGSHVHFDPYTSTREDMVKIAEGRRQNARRGGRPADDGYDDDGRGQKGCRSLQ